MKKYGHWPSPPDNRDFDATTLIGAAQTAPAEFLDLLPLVSIRDQTSTNTCFPAGTRVLMADYSERPIETVAIGNEVRTHTGRRGRVANTSCRAYTGELYTFEIFGWAYPLAATAEHPIAVFENTSERAKFGEFEPGALIWKPARNVSPGDRILMPANMNPEESDLAPVRLRVSDYLDQGFWDDGSKVRIVGGRANHELPAILEMSEQFARLVGLFLAEGSFIKPYGSPQGIILTFGSEETHLHEFTQQALLEIFKVNAEIVTDPDRPTVTRVRAYNATLAHFFKNMCGEGALWKSLDPKFFCAPRNVRLALLRGWFEGDGEHTPIALRKKKDGEVRKGAQICANTSSEELHIGLYRLASSCGIKLAARIRNREDHQNAPGRELNLYGPSILALFPEAQSLLDQEGVGVTSRTKYKRHDLGFICRISKVSRELVESVDVYNLEVEGDHTYVANGIAVHNCVWQAIAQAAKVFLAYRNSPKAEWLSVMFGYWNTLKAQGRGIVDDGCITRVALQTLTDAGFCDESAWPFVEANVLHQPLPNAYTLAFDQKLITNYYRLYSVGDALVTDVKRALAQGFPVIWASPVDAEYEKYSGGILGPRLGPWLGSHQRCLVGYTADYAIEANSWGLGWGLNGLANISWEFIKWPYSTEFWVFTGVPASSG